MEIIDYNLKIALPETGSIVDASGRAVTVRRVYAWGFGSDDLALFSPINDKRLVDHLSICGLYVEVCVIS